MVARELLNILDLSLFLEVIIMSGIGVEVGLITKSTREALINIAHGISFPLLCLNIEEVVKKSNTDVTLRVSPELYRSLLTRFGTNKILLYHDLRDGKIEAWSPSMHFSLDIMQKYRLMSSSRTWIKNAHISMNNILKNETKKVTLPKGRITKGFEVSKELISFAGLLETIDAKRDLFAITNDVISAQKKDSDSSIYRIAMMLYHSARLAGAPAIKDLEDPGSIYLKIMDTADFSMKHEYTYNALIKIQPEIRPAVIKTLYSFIISSYLYYSVMLDKVEV